MSDVNPPDEETEPLEPPQGDSSAVPPVPPIPSPPPPGRVAPSAAGEPMGGPPPKPPTGDPPPPAPPGDQPSAGGPPPPEPPPPPPGSTPPPPPGSTPPPPPPTPPPYGGESYGGAGAQGYRPPLRRSADDRVLAGLCGGLGRYLGIDPVLFRIGFVVFTLAWGVGLLIYLVGWIAIPEERPGERPTNGGGAAVNQATASMAIGGLLVLVGAFLIVDRLFPWLDAFIWPLLLIGLGVAIAVGGRR